MTKEASEATIAMAIARLRTELAEVRADRDAWKTQSQLNYLAFESATGGCNLAIAERDTLRTELAVAQADREQTIKNWEVDIRHMDANRETYKREIDTLRQQLAVAREGLEEIKLTDVYARLGREEKALRECGQIARDTLAKMEARP